MKCSCRSFIALLLSVTIMTLPMAGCSSGGSSRTEASANQLYYDSFADNNFTSHEMAQPPEDLFAAVKHFDLVAAGSSVRAASVLLAPGYAVYQPASAAGRVVPASVSASALPGEGIPGFKPQETIPPACQGLGDQELRSCLEELGEEAGGIAPASAHASYFDAGTLSVLFGETFATALVDKIIASKLDHVDSLTRDEIAAQLTDYINDGPAHIALDFSKHNIFDRDGYYLAGATFTDNSRGDVDGDGDLDQHTTLQIQVSKKIGYTRSSHSELDNVLQRYLGLVPQETYLIDLKVFIHLRNLAELRQAPPLHAPADPTIEEELAQLEQEWEAAWINKALDANILRKIVEHPELLPWESSEYMLSFQVAPENITQHLAPALAAAFEWGDGEAYTLIEQHLNAQTAIITGGSSTVSPAAAGTAAKPTVFYQVNLPRLVSPMAATPSGASYAMLDAAGRRVAIVDPASGALVLAEEPSKLPVGALSVQPAWTKGGACQGDRGNWAYWPSRVRTGNFGRGINWIITESFLHNQVGDYKNIHWYQSGWKAAAQVAIKSGMWVVKNYLQAQFAGAAVPAKKSDYALYYIMEVLAPYMASYLGNGKGGGRSFKIAGYGFEVPKVIPEFWRTASKAPKNETFAQKIGNQALSFLIDKVTDGVGQTLDVTVTGWQDYSDASHYGCFAFSY
ncbi:MAG: hypothetical protein IH614_09395 [Desulfuromonadales bacterium]|nr:hypothetical protein [Desulfuromonadales bacterium]